METTINPIHHFLQNAQESPEFSNENELGLAINTSTPMRKSSAIHENLYMCRVCEDSFATVEQLTNHLSSVHEGKNPIELNDTNDPENDSKVETPKKKDESFNDSTQTISESLLLNHTNDSLNDSNSKGPAQKKLSNTPTRFQCSYCDCNYSQKSSLYTHVKLKHGENSKSKGKLEPSSNKVSKKTFQCPYCESKFSNNKQNLKSHVKQKHEENFNKTDFRNIKVEISHDLENNLKTPPINRKRKSNGESGNAKKPCQISKVQTQSEETINNLEEFEVGDVEPTETQKLPTHVDPIKKPFVTLHQVLGEDDL